MTYYTQVPREHNAPRLRALIYNRVSADPSGSRVSVRSQDEENRAFCERMGWEIAGTITDNDRSATRYAVRAREGYLEASKALAGRSSYGRIDVLVCWEASRANRGLEGYVELRKLCDEFNVQLAYKGQVHDLRTSQGRFATGVDVLFAEREADEIRERILRSHRDSARRGTPRGVTPYGYMREYDVHSGRMLTQVPNPETAPVVREIVRRILGGETLYSVAQDLNRREVPTPRGYRDLQAGVEPETPRPGWSSSMIRNLLSKQSLMGIRTHNGEVVGDATWEAIVPADEWRAVQAVLADPSRANNPRGVKVRYLLSGIARCAVCEAWLRPMKNRGRMTYVCGGMTPTSSKGHVSRDTKNLDAYVTAAVLLRVSRPDFLEQQRKFLSDQTSETDHTQREAQREVAELQARIAEFEEAAASRKGASAERVLRILDDLDAQLAEAQARAQPKNVDPVVFEIAGPYAAQVWASDEFTIDKQRRVVRALVDVQVHRATARGRRELEMSTIDLRWR